MRERPIIFSAPMVRAILDGRKTQTRRVVKNPERLEGLMLAGEEDEWCPYGRPGEVLWCRESWGRVEPHPSIGEDYGLPVVDVAQNPNLLAYWRKRIVYRADGNGEPGDGRWRSPIHMPRWASRLSLRVEEVRVERLCDIEESDVLAEGAVSVDRFEGPGSYSLYRLGEHVSDCPIECYAMAWDDINGERAPWDSNPWVWVVTFSLMEDADV